MAQKERESGLELLRILCLVLVFWMHGASSYDNNNLSAWLCVVIETIGNIGVPIFILISGYFGIKLKPAKMIQLDMMLAFYCWIGLAMFFFWGEAQSFGGSQILTYLFPAIGRYSWYFTCYFALAFLSPFLNEYVEKIDKQTFRRLLIAMLIIFSGITTFCFYDITQDGGKGIVNMVLIYLIGRYIRMYEEDFSFKRSKLIGAYAVITLVCIALNGALYAVTGTVQNRFSRDNTLFTIFASVCIFLIFKDIHFKNTFINRVATHVPAIFIMEWTVRGVITHYIFDYLAWKEHDTYQLILLGIAVLLVVMGTVIDEVRVGVFGRVEQKASVKLYEVIQKALSKINIIK